MQKVVLVEMYSPIKAVGGSQAVGVAAGTIDRELSPGRYEVFLDKGDKISASGLPGLKRGSKVQVLPPVSRPVDTKNLASAKNLSMDGPGAHWKASFPFLLGGGLGSANLRVFVQKKSGTIGGARAPAVYLLFSLRTEKKGEIQWSIYLKGRQISMQVYAEPAKREPKETADLAAGLEKKLKSKGFVLLAPTVVLKKPFKVPEGFRLSVEG